MILSTYHGSIANQYGDAEAIKLIKRAGFDGIDYSFCGTLYSPIYFDDYIMQAKHVKSVLDSENMACVQSHAPFTLTCNMKRSKDNEHYNTILQSLEMSAILGTDKCVVHPLAPPNGVDYFNYNLDYFGELEKYAKEYGVKILVENVWTDKVNISDKYYPALFGTPEEMKRFIDQINSPFVKAVVDVGHAELVGTDPAEYIRGLDNSTLLALHIHDNDGTFDNHFAPYEGILNWGDILKALADIDYKGDMNLELEYSRKRPKDLIFPCLEYRAKVGRYLIDEFRKCVIANLQAKSKAKK